MAKDEFDMDFDFEKEYGFDPNEFLEGDQDADIDFSGFIQEEPQEKPARQKDELDDLDLDDLDLSDLDLGDVDLSDGGLGDMDLGDVDLGDIGLDDVDLGDVDLGDVDMAGDFDFSDESFGAEGISVDDLDPDSFLQDAYAMHTPREEPAEEPLDGPDVLIGRRRDPEPFPEAEDFDATDFDEEDFEKTVFGENPAFQNPQYQEYQEPQYQEPQYQEPQYQDYQAPQYPQSGSDGEDFDDQFYPAADAAPQKEPRRKKEPKPPREKPAPPAFITKLVEYYMAPLREAEQPVDPNNPRRRRRKRTKAQIFKEVYLPPLLAGLTLILILVFVIGSISNAIQQKKIDNDIAVQESQKEAEEAARLEEETRKILEEAERLAQGYDYQGAIDMLHSFSGEMTQEMNMKIAEYTNTINSLVEYKDYSSIPNLSFHVLIADPERAFADKDLGGQYNRNFVTIDEFSKILEQLYKAGYVLVDFDSFTETNTGLDGNANFFTTPITLPEGKKPVMITETMVNYLSYMVDSNDDGEPDAGGAGFAYRMIVDNNGDIKAQMVDANGQTQTGNYDLVPILEDFIKEHPDFSYKGARATLAVCGYEGVFGYRTNTSYISSVSQAYYDEQVAGAKTLVEALRNKGYTLACYTYGNVAYGDRSATQIQADMQEWTSQITPVLGQVDVLVYARTSDIGDYGGAKFQVLHGCGFRYFLRHGSQPYAEINNTYVKQSRLMVTGENMAWNSSQFNGMFDCAAILNNLRGNVPKG